MPGPLCRQEAGGRAPPRPGAGRARGLQSPPARCPPESGSPGGKASPGRPTPGRRAGGGAREGSLPELTESRAWRMTTCGAIGVAGRSLWSPLATCRSSPETSSPYRKRSLKNTMAAAVAQSRATMEAFRDACGDIPGRDEPHGGRAPHEKAARGPSLVF